MPVDVSNPDDSSPTSSRFRSTSEADADDDDNSTSLYSTAHQGHQCREVRKTMTETETQLLEIIDQYPVTDQFNSYFR